MGKSSGYSVVELCAGAGGQALGLEKAGLSHSAAVEIDNDACDTLEYNRPTWNVLRGSVTDPLVFNASQYVGVDVLAGGVPCPPFSLAGKQLGAGDERDLYAFAVHLVDRIRPKALLLENVRGLSARRFGGYRAYLESLLEGWGYQCEWRLLQASDFGVPQLRPRFILVALEQEYAPFFQWPSLEAEAPTVGEVLFPLMASGGWLGAEKWRAGADRIAPTIVGGSKKHGGADLGPTRAKKAWAQLGVDGKGVADEPPNGSHPVGFTPRLTNEMVALIQGWVAGDQWKFMGKKTSTYRQIGNAFPPPVAHALGESLVAALSQAGEPRSEQEREAEADKAVYQSLAAVPGRFVTVQSLTDSTGQTSEQVAEAISHLEADFVIDIRTPGGIPRYRLTDFKGRVGEKHEQLELTTNETIPY